MPRELAMLQLDVFADAPLSGNPLAVYPDASGLEAAEMQAIAKEMNLSETTFVLPSESPEADYRVRIFTPESELPFAGHPTLGTAWALLDGGRFAERGEAFTLRQQTLAGIQAIDVEGIGDARRLCMTLPPPTFAGGPAASDVAEALGVDPATIVGDPTTVSVGVAWHIVELDTLETLHAVVPDLARVAALLPEAAVGTTIFCEGAADPACVIRLRSFAPAEGINEDPVCGSGNGCVGAYRARRDAITAPLEYRAEQGIEVSRAGNAEVTITPLDEAPGDYRVQVGGRAVVVLRGTLLL